jgi:hypothetical protein
MKSWESIATIYSTVLHLSRPCPSCTAGTLFAGAHPAPVTATCFWNSRTGLLIRSRRFLQYQIATSFCSIGSPSFRPDPHDPTPARAESDKAASRVTVAEPQGPARFARGWAQASLGMIEHVGTIACRRGNLGPKIFHAFCVSACSPLFVYVNRHSALHIIA